MSKHAKASKPGKPLKKRSLEELTALYKEMLYYRRFEERVQLAYTSQKFSGFCHLHIGQEAVAVGVQRALQDGDYMIGSYRSHTQAIAKGIKGEEVFAELFGKVTGCSRGKGGSMHMFSEKHRFLGGHGIVGGQTPIAAGVAFAIKYRKEKWVCVCYLGDAAANQGQFFEALNMAATWDLPVLYIIENNRYGMGTDIRRTTSVDALEKRALAFDMAHSQIDGMNVLTVLDHCEMLVTKMREDQKPHLLEIMTYRYKGHSVSDPGLYRTKEEVKKFQDLDPILQLKGLLQAEFNIKDDMFAAYDEEIKERVKREEAFADASPVPDVSEVYKDVFFENSSRR